MSYFDKNEFIAVNPQGEEAFLPISGIAAHSHTPLKAGESWTSGTVYYKGNDSVHFAFSSDVPGTYLVEYFEGGEQVQFIGNPVAFDPNLVASFQGGLAGKGDSFKLTYTNGDKDQSRFYCEVRFSNNVQQTMRSMAIPMSSTNMGGTTHAAIEGKETLTGAYKQATISQVGEKVALDVNVINRSNEIQKVSVSNFPDTQKVTVTNFPIPTDNQKIIVTNFPTPVDIQKVQVTNFSSDSKTATQSFLDITSSKTIPANLNRKGLFIYNITSPVYIFYGTQMVARVAYIPKNSAWEMNKIYTGEITVKLESAATRIEITELT